MIILDKCKVKTKTAKFSDGDLIYFTCCCPNCNTHNRLKYKGKFICRFCGKLISIQRIN